MVASQLQSKLVAWQCYISFVRVVTTIYLIIYWAMRLDAICINMSGVRPYFNEHKSTFSQSELELNLRYYRLWIIKATCWIVSASLLLLNDIFILTADRKRTNTYLGCLAIQAVANCCFSGFNALSIVQQVREELFTDDIIYSPYVVLAVSLPLSELCSLCLLGICLWPIVALRSHAPMKQLWKTNTKDAFQGMVLSKVELGVLGHPRETTREIALPGPLGIICGLVKRHLYHLFFRRIRPVETRVYAFSRNWFAIVAMVILIFRTITALQQAQNEIETRTTSTTCDDASTSHSISILSERLIHDSRWDTSLPEDINITISAVWNDPSRGSNTTRCTLESARTFNNTLGINLFQNRSLELFSCQWNPDPMYNSWDTWYSQGLFSDTFVYRVEVRPLTVIPGGMIFDSQMPHIWLVNSDELPRPADRNWSDVGEIRAYLPPLKLSRGFNMRTEANLITRRFIKSSIVRDIILHFKPDYRRLSLYPIVESSVVTLNSSDSNIATATIRPTLSPGLMYHRNQVTIDNSDPNELPASVCDYIEDYRTGTFIDVIGSVGGLFALLQAAHLLLFGRPLLWGLTGAKTMTPFGLLGGCSSRGFRRRLRDEYHSQSGEDGADTIQIVKFLRDFVIDFGPADLDVERAEGKSVPSPNEVGSKEDPAGTDIPLIQMGSDSTNETNEKCDVDEIIHIHRSDHDRSKTI